LKIPGDIFPEVVEPGIKINNIKKEMEKAKKIILVENNVTGQLGRLIREKTGIKIEKRISIRLFEKKQVRSLWNPDEEKWYFFDCGCCKCVKQY